jgi:hypothetical protein
MSAGVPPVGLPAKLGCVNGQHDRAETGRDRLIDQLACEAAIGEAVELEPAWRFRRSGGHLGRRRSGKRRQHHDRAGRGCRAGHAGLAIGMGHALERDRGNQQRHRDLGTEHAGRGGRGANVDQRARAQPQARKRLHVVAQGALVAGTPRVVVIRTRIEALASELFVVEDVAGLGRHSPRA